MVEGGVPGAPAPAVPRPEEDGVPGPEEDGVPGSAPVDPVRAAGSGGSAAAEASGGSVTPSP
ncbi:hypothetical protein GCM10010433_70180 [Streptomyces pulveraceus]